MVRRIIKKVSEKLLGKKAETVSEKKGGSQNTSRHRHVKSPGSVPSPEPAATEVYEPGASKRKKSKSSPRKRPSRGRSSGGASARPPKDRERAPEKKKDMGEWDISKFQVPEKEGSVRFHDLDLPAEIMRAIADLGFQYGTPIQSEILPSTLKGLDAAGRAQTGTGKTAAFLITALTHIVKNPITTKRRPGTPRVLVIAPTRELVIQIEKEAKELGRYTGAEMVAVFGGMDYEKQKQQLSSSSADVVVATPGRLLDFNRKGDIKLNQVEILVLDEADRMLDMGFIPDVRSIIHSTPPKAKRQTLLFSATLTPEVMRLASQWTTDPVMVEIEPDQVAVDTVDQKIYITTIKDKFALLVNILKQSTDDKPVIVFANRRDETQKLVDHLKDYGVECALLSGAVSQVNRLKTLERFKSGQIKVLVATDVAGRGLHVDDVGHVINYSLPQDPEDYVHRIGRTGRAGASGISISFACEEDSFAIPDIEKYVGRDLPCSYPDEELLKLPDPPTRTRRPSRGQDRSENRGSGRSGGGGRPRRRPRPSGRGPRGPRSDSGNKSP